MDMQSGDLRDETCFSYVRSCQLPMNMKIKINYIDNHTAAPTALEIYRNPVLAFSPWANTKKRADLYIQCQVYDGKFPFSLKAQTPFIEMTNRWDYYHWIELPILVCDLPRHAKLIFTIWDSRSPGKMFCLGTSSVDIFDAHGEMNTGKKDLRVIDPTKDDPPEIKKIVHTLSELELKISKYERGESMKIDWMDRLAFKEIHQLTDKLKRESGSLFLNVQFPVFKTNKGKVSVLYFEQGSLQANMYPQMPKYCKLYDPSASKENIIEKKHLALARSLRSGLSDRDIRPNAEVKNKLTEIMEYPPTTVLTESELDLVWKHRHYLSEHKAGLTKFLRCINWENADQTKAAKELLANWAVVNAENALELLGPNFTEPEVRRYAVNRLGQSSDDDLMLYLLQLVQALKFEAVQPDIFTFNEAHYSDDFNIISPNKSDSNVATEPSDNSSIDSARTNSMSSEAPASINKQSGNKRNGSNGEEEYNSLVELLVARACNNLPLATSLYWFLKVECDSNAEKQQQQQGQKGGSVCRHALDRLRNELRLGNSKSRNILSVLNRQDQMIRTLVTVIQGMRNESLSREQKVNYLRNTLSDPELMVTNMKPLPLPLDPTIQITGIDLDSIRVFKSALEPCKLAFRTIEDGDTKFYNTIFKVGDDLRQDQLILQLITLLHRLLLRENLDLKLSPYRVLATAPNHGLVEFIDAAVVADILREESISSFLKRHNPDPNAPLGVAPQVLGNYTRSCAGYCIITYILGVGDRHHDNLMLTKDGCFFHIDFGYILGRDPKPLPPLIKLSKEISEGLGGQGCEQYQHFLQLCRTTFLCLRRHANLVLNLFSLMVDASIPDIALEPEKAVKKVEERFHLDLTDEQASSKILSVLHDSANTVMGAVNENLHKFSQYIRN